jgi:hypothetical protein
LGVLGGEGEEWLLGLSMGVASWPR